MASDREERLRKIMAKVSEDLHAEHSQRDLIVGLAFGNLALSSHPVPREEIERAYDELEQSGWFI